MVSKSSSKRPSVTAVIELNVLDAVAVFPRAILLKSAERNFHHIMFITRTNDRIMTG